MSGLINKVKVIMQNTSQSKSVMVNDTEILITDIKINKDCNGLPIVTITFPSESVEWIPAKLEELL
jgi:hypothetical protein